MNKGQTLVGVISDTHGLLRPEVIPLLSNCSLIIHAGDVGHEGVLEKLESIAPVVAVRGNVDTDNWAARLPEVAELTVAVFPILVLHDLSRLSIDPAERGFKVVIFGHSHKPAKETHGGVLYLNPGSAGPRRFRLPIGLAYLKADNDRIEAELVTLER